MELNFTELDNINTMNPYSSFDYNSYNNNQNYWDNQKKQESDIKKKKVSFNDILTNMNLVVNKEGVLQFMTPIKNETTQYEYNLNDFSKNNYNQNQQNDFQQNQYINNTPKQTQKNNEPLDPNLKHSYIYNKYFKNYVDNNVEKQGPRVPKTLEEYKRMLLEDKIKAIEHKKMVEQIKSKKMMFTTTPAMTINPKNIQASKNNLRMMSFR